MCEGRGEKEESEKEASCTLSVGGGDAARDEQAGKGTAREEMSQG